MSDKLRTALQALDRELDRLQRNATDQAQRHEQEKQAAAAAVADVSPRPEPNPQMTLTLVSMRDRVDSSIERLETMLKESAGGAG